MSSKSILIIEDDAALLRGLKDNFETEGYDVRTANDGQKGLDSLFKAPPSLLLLDLMLPKVNGYEICRQARTRQLKMPIIMLTAKGQKEDNVLLLAFRCEHDDRHIQLAGPGLPANFIAVDLR